MISTRNRGSCVIPARAVRMTNHPVLITQYEPVVQPEVELTRVDGRVTSMRVQCTCGRVMVAECEYEK
ncbi:MAG: hypothetical protein R3C18_05120 [Planctomycetaceae bacterium]